MDPAGTISTRILSLSQLDKSLGSTIEERRGAGRLRLAIFDVHSLVVLLDLQGPFIFVDWLLIDAVFASALTELL